MTEDNGPTKALMIRDLSDGPFTMWIENDLLWVEDYDHIRLNLSLLDPSIFNDDDRSHIVFRMLLARRNNRTSTIWAIEQKEAVTRLLNQWGE